MLRRVRSHPGRPLLTLFISGAHPVQRRQFVLSTAAALAAPAVLRNALAQEGGLSGKSLTIGCSAALSGPLAGFGTDLRQGAEAAIAQINARGGVHGRALQLHMVDDGYVPQRTIDNVKQMLGQGSAFALLSCVGTPNNTAILPMVEEAGIPYVAPLTGASSLRKNARNVFHVRASYTEEVQRLVQRLMGMGVKEIGIVFLDNAYGRELLEDANRALAAAGGKASVQAALATDGKNLDAVLAQVDAAHPSAVLMVTAGAATVPLVRGLRKVLPGVLMAGVSASLTGDAYKQLGEIGRGLAVTMVMPDPTKGKNAVVRDYQAAMKVRGQQEFGLGSLEGYVNMRVLAEGLERAGSDPTRAKLRSALAGIRNWDMGGFVVDYGGQAPYVGSRYIDLGVLGPAGKFLA
jgi:ABC-type branched-subunit amino acid transport system substrate-binding protein